MPEPAEPRLRLGPTQQALLEALIDQRPEFGEWYRAAVAAVNDAGLPDRLALAAHALREVMEKLPGDGVRLDRGADLPTKVRRLRPPWDQARSEDQRNGGTWNGEIRVSLRAFLETMQTFFDCQDELVMTRRETTVRFLRGLEVAPAGLPDDVREENAKQWMRFHRYFDGVAHHGTVEERGFREQVGRWEAFLSSRLILRPTDDFGTIDALVQEE